MDNIDRLTNLLEKLHLDQTNMAKLDDEDAEGVILEVDSDLEDPTFNMEGSGTITPVKRPKTEEGEPSNSNSITTVTRKIEDSYRDYNNKVRYANIKKGVPPKYQQKERGIEDEILNKDCAENGEELVLTWINKLKLKVQAGDEAVRDLTLQDFTIYLQYQTTGVLADWAANTQLQYPPGYTGSEVSVEGKLAFLNQLAQAIFAEFYGYGPDEARKEDKPNVIRILSNMKLCDPCYIENFFCQVEAVYYKVADRSGLIDIILSKLAAPMVTYIQTQINDPVRTKRLLTLGLIRRFAVEYRQQLCLRKIEKNYIKNVDPRCCKQLEDVPQEYGCGTSRRRPRESYSKRRLRARKYPSRRWKSKYKRKFRKRTSGKKTDKKKTCPRGKKSCRCWICQEKRHYANECPQRENKPRKTQKLHMLYNFGYEPIEDDYDSDQTVDFDIYSLSTTSDDDSSESKYELEE